MPSTNGHGLKRSVLWVILYARVSTDEQARSGYSLAQQLEALREYAAREGYEVLEEVVDAGESGATLERPGLDRVRDLVAAGGVYVVLAQDRDRFSREPAYLYLLREEFAEHSTTLKCLNDRGDDSPEGQLTDGILDQLAKYERAKTAERSRRGKKQKAKGGKILSSRAAYGFGWNESRDGYVVDPEQMAVLRRIFYMAGVERRSLCAIRNQLRQDGVPSPTGKPIWDIQGIRKLLKRDLYRPHSFEELRRAGVSEEVLGGRRPRGPLRSLLLRRAPGEAQEDLRGLAKRSRRTGVPLPLHVRHAAARGARRRTGPGCGHPPGVGRGGEGGPREKPAPRQRG